MNKIQDLVCTYIVDEYLKGIKSTQKRLKQKLEPSNEDLASAFAQGAQPQEYKHAFGSPISNNPMVKACDDIFFFLSTKFM